MKLLIVSVLAASLYVSSAAISRPFCFFAYHVDLSDVPDSLLLISFLLRLILLICPPPPRALRMGVM